MTQSPVKPCTNCQESIRILRRMVDALKSDPFFPDNEKYAAMQVAIEYLQRTEKGSIENDVEMVR